MLSGGCRGTLAPTSNLPRMPSGERFWSNRLRWRLRGATMWPTFVAATLLEGWLLHHWPPLRFGFSETGIDIGAGIIIAAFSNLFLVAAITPWLAKQLVLRRQRERPGQVSDRALLEVFKDRTGTALLAVGTLGVLAAGLASIPLINGETDARNRADRALISYVDGHAPPDVRQNNNQGVANTRRLGKGLFRTCIPRGNRRSYFCVRINTNHRPTRVVRDSNDPNPPRSGY